MMGHIWGPQGWVQGSLAVQKSPKLKSLHMELQETLPKAFRSIHSSRWRRLLSTTLSSHPVGELWQWNLHITSAKRAKIIADCILGSLAFVALFFSVDGSAVAARKASDCPVQQGTFLWYAFVAIASICLNLIPRSLITYFAYRGFVQHRPSDPYCVVNVSRSSESKRKWQPWKGMGRTRTIKGNCNPSWNEAFLMQYVLEEDAIHFSVWDEDALSKDRHKPESPQDDALGEVLLPSPAFWCGFEGDLRLQGVNDASLRVSIRPYDCNADGVAALDNFREKVSERKPSKRVLHIRDAEASEALPSNGADSLDLSEKLVVIPSPRLWPLEASRGAFEEKAPTVSGLSYASCVNMGRPCPAEKMVTHSWGNKFSYLIGAILGDALQAERYDGVVELLKKHQFQELCEALTRNESLDTPYWEMNKFDDMMAYLKRHLRRMSTTVRLEQVVAMEPDFALLKRVWCIAELVEANELHLNQTIMIHSAASRNECLHRLFSLDVRMAEASYPADKDLILAKIVDVDRAKLKHCAVHVLPLCLSLLLGARGDLAVVRTFASNKEVDGLQAAFQLWEELMPCTEPRVSVDLILVYSQSFENQNAL
eukprot:g9102.t1